MNDRTRGRPVVVTEAELRQQLRPPRVGATVRVPAGAQLSPSAQDLVRQWQLELREDAGLPPARRADAAGAWDRPSTFPVVLEGDQPRCVTCGGHVTDKPDQLTQLDACHMAPKTHPRIVLRGRLDSLQALAMLAGARARAEDDDVLAAGLGTVAAYCRELLSAEYNERPAAPPELPGWDEAAIHRATHDPEGVLGIAHLTPRVEDAELLHWCNLLRCQAREVEVTAAATFPSPHHPYGASIVHGCNRLSSVVYLLELQLQRARAGAS